MGDRATKTACLIVIGAAAAGVLAPSVTAAPSPAGLASMGERVCATPAPGNAACDAILRVEAPARQSGHKPSPGSSPVSYDASQIQTAYGLTGASASLGAGTTVAIVDAYDDPNAYADLVAYRTSATENLGTITQCSVAGATLTSPSSTEPCFAKVNESGAPGPFPAASTSWSEEISVDLDMVSATCPRCNILLVEAASASLSDLGTAVDTSAQFAPAAIGNSYGAAEFSTEAAYASAYYDHRGIAVTVAAGDNGYGVEFPAAAPDVVAVGGTTLTDSGGSYMQTVWDGTGSGCSAYIPKPSWQTDSGCANRTVADVAAVADPNTGVDVYDSYGESGWLVFGGTSVAAQIVAGIFGLAGGGGAASLYAGATGGIYDVTSGSNGSCTGHGHYANPAVAYLCTAEVGYDGPSGMGAPEGISRF